MEEIKNKFPKTTFIHFTVPLTSKQTWLKEFVKGRIGKVNLYDNVQRNELNAILRREYVGREPFFDLAKLESTFPDSRQSTFTQDGNIYSSLVPDYTNDGGHLNEKGRRIVAEHLLVYLAQLSQCSDIVSLSEAVENVDEGHRVKPMIVAPYSGLVFWLLQMLFASGHSLFRWVSFMPGVRNTFMIAGSVCVILLAQHERNGYFVLFLLIALSTSVYYTGKKIASSTCLYTKNTFYFCIIMIIVIFLFYYKYVFFQKFLNYILFSIVYYNVKVQYNSHQHMFLFGVSYLSFKFISFIVDSYSDKIKEYNYLTFMNYILFFPNFFCGPINRYQNFANDVHNINSIILFPNIAVGIKRIINGLFKKTVANALIPFSISSIDLSSSSVTQVDAIVSVYFYMLYIYLDFSGYSDMAIGSAKLVGIHLPENFDWPFLRRNLQQFWAHWHMSLSAWLMDYIYWPLARKGRHIEGLRRKPVTNSNICIVVTFIVCGLWHGESINFLIWGTYHGIGLALLNVYSHWEKKYAPIAWRKFMNTSRIAYICSTLITIQYVAFGFLLFACDIDRLQQFLSLFF